MFTGLIEEIGIVKKILRHKDASELTISCKKVLEDIKNGDSIAVDGVCQTITKFDKNSFSVLAVKETLNRTNFQYYKIGTKVNLERSLKISDRLHGHIVLGHVDGTSHVTEIIKKEKYWLLSIYLEEQYKKYCVEKGSLALNGISLTIAGIKNNNITISIIPNTINETNLQYLKKGERVNIEFDILGKYVFNQSKK